MDTTYNGLTETKIVVNMPNLISNLYRKITFAFHF